MAVDGSCPGVVVVVEVDVVGAVQPQLLHCGGLLAVALTPSQQVDGSSQMFVPQEWLASYGQGLPVPPTLLPEIWLHRVSLPVHLHCGLVPALG